MATVVSQDIQSSFSPNKRAELKFTIRGAISEAAAYAALDSSGLAPTTFESIPRRETTIETEHFIAENTDKNIFRATVSYYTKASEANDNVASFDTTGGSQHVTQSYATTRFPSGSPDLQGAINFDGEKVGGVDIIIPALIFTEQHYKTLSFCNDNYRKTLAEMTGTMNNGTFRGNPSGSVLFKGASGQQTIVDDIKQWLVSYTFAISPNRSNFTIGGITVAQKLGWDYLWVLYADTVDGNTLIKRPANVYVERIYEFSSFSNLGI